MSLKTLNRTDLDLYLKNLVKKEREVLHSILETIREIDSRRMYLEMGFSSLFDYLTIAVGYSNASAQRRIDAARLLAEIPQLGEKIQSGELKLNQISMVQKAARDVAKLKHQKVTSTEKAILLDTIASQTVQQTQKEIASFFDIPVAQFTTQKVQADESVRIELTLPKEVYEKLQRAQALLSSAVPTKDVVSFIEYVSDKIIKQRASADERINQKKETKPFSKKVARARVAIPAKTFSLPMWKRQAHTKQSCCQYKDPVTGKICGSQRFLQVDHKTSRWANGSNSTDNLQILCAGHNGLKYRLEAGITYV